MKILKTEKFKTQNLNLKIQMCKIKKHGTWHIWTIKLDTKMKVENENIKNWKV